MPKRLISQSEWAKTHGFSRQYVNKLLKTQKIVLVDGKIDPLDADRRLAAFQNPLRQATKGKSHVNSVDSVQERRVSREEDEDTSNLREDELPAGSLSDQLLRARIKREREEGTLKELERKKRQGELIDAEEVKAASQTRANAEREALLAWPRRVAADMAVDLGADERLVLQTLQKYIRQHLVERAGQPVTTEIDLDLE